jgi:hypothetical protein
MPVDISTVQQKIFIYPVVDRHKLPFSSKPLIVWSKLARAFTELGLSVQSPVIQTANGKQQETHSSGKIFRCLQPFMPSIVLREASKN